MTLFKSVALFFLVIPFQLHSTFICQCYWNWFFVEAFGVPHISFMLMLGVHLAFGWILGKDGEESGEGDWVKTFFVRMIVRAVAGTVALGMGFLVHQFV